MLVDSLSKMEQIVSSNPELKWEGWDVVRYKKNPSAQFEANGSFQNGVWCKRFVFPITERGWSIPNNIGERYV